VPYGGGGVGGPALFPGQGINGFGHGGFPNYNNFNPASQGHGHGFSQIHSQGIGAFGNGGYPQNGILVGPGGPTGMIGRPYGFGNGFNGISGGHGGQFHGAGLGIGGGYGGQFPGAGHGGGYGGQFPGAGLGIGGGYGGQFPGAGIGIGGGFNGGFNNQGFGGIGGDGFPQGGGGGLFHDSTNNNQNKQQNFKRVEKSIE
jgi:hypothetical protein